MVRYSLFTIFLLLTTTALGIAALINATELWLAGMTTLTVFLLLFTLLGAVLGKGVWRGFATGFTIFAGGYLLLSMFGPIRESLLTTKANRIALRALHPEAEVERIGVDIDFTPWISWNPTGSTSPTALIVTNSNTVHIHFLRIAQCLWSWMFGLVGGLAALWILDKQKNKQKNELKNEQRTTSSATANVDQA